MCRGEYGCTCFAENAEMVQVPELLRPLSKPEQPHYVKSAAPCPSCGYLIEPIDITDMFNLDGFEMNVNKYLLRYKHKGEAVKDLKKLVQYSQWLLERAERGDVI